MEARTLIGTTAATIIGVQVALFAWLKTDVASITERLDRVVAFVREQLSLALPALAQQAGKPPPKPEP